MYRSLVALGTLLQGSESSQAVVKASPALVACLQRLVAGAEPRIQQASKQLLALVHGDC